MFRISSYLEGMILLLFYLTFVIGCNEQKTPNPSDYAFEIRVYDFPPHSGNQKAIVDTLTNGDSIIVAIDIKWLKSFFKQPTTTNAPTNDPVPVIISENSINIRSSCDIRVGTDTIKAGANLYAFANRQIISVPSYLQYTGAVYLRKEAEYPLGECRFYFDGEDNYGIHHSDTTSVIVR